MLRLFVVIYLTGERIVFILKVKHLTNNPSGGERRKYLSRNLVISEPN